MAASEASLASLVAPLSGWRRTRPSAPVLTLAVALVLSVPFMVLSVVDESGPSQLWDNLHWTISAVGAAVAAVLSVGGTTGRIRQVRILSAAALVLWMLATLTWAWLSATGGPSVPSLADLFILAIIVPGVGIVVASVRGLLSTAEEIAVYLDGTLGFLLIVALLVILVGPLAVSLPAASSFVAVAYPTAFVGLGGAGLIAVLAVGYPVSPRGPIALLGGSTMIGLAYLGWTLTAFNLGDPGELSSACFTIGTLLAGYGAVTWRDDRSTNERYLAFARSATHVVAPVVASLLVLLMIAPIPESIAEIVHGAIVVASILFITRQGLLLRERTGMLSALTTLTNENTRLVAELRIELDRRAHDQRRMIQASRSAAVGELAATVAHEVNNPLTGVLGYAELLLVELDAEDPSRADLEIIRDEALRARSIVRALREFASPRPPSLEPTDLGDLVHRTVDLVRYGIERRGATIHEELGELPPALIDAHAIQQAILNILTNASQAIEDNGRIDIVVRADGEHQLVSITDDGVGMDEATAGQAFEPFFSTRGGPDGEPSQTGLGLSISHGLIEVHGGTINLHSLPGEGTTVDVRLPTTQASASIVDGQGRKVA